MADDSQDLAVHIFSDTSSLTSADLFGEVSDLKENQEPGYFFHIHTQQIF